MSNPKVVIKYGGHAMDMPALARAFHKDIYDLYQEKWHFVIVHGGGPQINDLLEKLHIKTEFVDGLRVTDAAAMAAVEMALCGAVNKSVVRDMEKMGLKAVGISGEDGGMLLARPINPALGRVGEVFRVNVDLPHALIESGFIPIIAPVGVDEEGKAININADTAAGALAGAMRADYFALVSNVPGVLDRQGKLIRQINVKDAEALREEGVITAGMIPKVAACVHALERGCRRALILDGTKQGSLRRFLHGNEPLGTLITD